MLEIVQCPIRVLPREPAELGNLILGNLQPSLSGGKRCGLNNSAKQYATRPVASWKRTVSMRAT